MIDAVIAIFFASYIFVFLKSFQQRNVAFDKYWWIMPTSMSMAFAEAYVVFKLATAGEYSVPLVLGLGLGAGSGSLCATILHKRLFIKLEKENNND